MEPLYLSRISIAAAPGPSHLSSPPRPVASVLTQDFARRGRIRQRRGGHRGGRGGGGGGGGGRGRGGGGGGARGGRGGGARGRALCLSRISIAAAQGPSQPPSPPEPLDSVLTQDFARAPRRRRPLLPLPQPPPAFTPLRWSGPGRGWPRGSSARREEVGREGGGGRRRGSRVESPRGDHTLTLAVWRSIKA